MSEGKNATTEAPLSMKTFPSGHRNLTGAELDALLEHYCSEDYVFKRPSGELGQKLGRVNVCVLALAAAVGLSADTEERREVARMMARLGAERRTP